MAKRRLNLRWLIGVYSDPEFDLSPEEQRRATKLAHEKHLSPRSLLIYTAVLILACIGLVMFGHMPLARVFERIGVPYAMITSMVVLCIVSVVIAAWSYRWMYLRPIRMAMRDMGFDICVGCGYQLQGLTDDIHRCPECGRPRPAPILQDQQSDDAHSV